MSRSSATVLPSQSMSATWSTKAMWSRPGITPRSVLVFPTAPRSTSSPIRGWHSVTIRMIRRTTLLCSISSKAACPSSPAKWRTQSHACRHAGGDIGHSRHRGIVRHEFRAMRRLLYSFGARRGRHPRTAITSAPTRSGTTGRIRRLRRDRPLITNSGYVTSVELQGSGLPPIVTTEPITNWPVYSDRPILQDLVDSYGQFNGSGGIHSPGSGDNPILFVPPPLSRMAGSPSTSIFRREVAPTPDYDGQHYFRHNSPPIPDRRPMSSFGAAAL